MDSDDEFESVEEYIKKYCDRQPRIELPYTMFPSPKLDIYTAQPVQLIYHPGIPYRCYTLRNYYIYVITQILIMMLCPTPNL